MHVALVHHHVGGPAGGGGAVRLMVELALKLQDRGHRVTIACHDHLAGGEFAYATDRLDIRAVREGVSEIPTGRLQLARRFWRDLPKVSRLVPPDADVVNAHEWLALRPGRIAARRLRVPLVWTRNDEAPWERAVVPEHTIVGGQGTLERIGRGAIGWPDLLDARRAAAIVVLSRQQAEMVRRSYRRDATVLGIGPPEHFFEPPGRAEARARLGVPKDASLVMAAGILVPHRRFEDLLDAMALLGDEPSLRALIVGSDHFDRDYSDSLTAKIGQLGLGERVEMPRRSVTDAEMHDAYAAADVFAILSQRYAWGLAPLEAIASGTPVIITPGAGVHDVLAGRPGVHVVPAEDPAAVAEAIRAARGMDGREAIEPTREWLRKALGLDRYADQMEQIYSRVTGL